MGLKKKTGCVGYSIFREIIMDLMKTKQFYQDKNKIREDTICLMTI